MPILLPLDIQVSLEADVQRIGSVPCLHERCWNRIDAILPALPPQHFSIGPNDNPPLRHRDTKTWTNILDVVRAYKIRLTKIDSFGKESIESTKRALRRVVITACYTPIEAQTVVDFLPFAGSDRETRNCSSPSMLELDGRQRCQIPFARATIASIR